MARKEIIIYQTKEGREPFREWITNFKDKVTRARIERRLEKVEEGHYGDYKNLGDDIYELRYFFGAGYRVYFAEYGDTIVLLLCGGDKSSQSKDISKAKEYWKDYLTTKHKEDVEPEAADKETKKQEDKS
jgi:putative addiction module killer protein